MTLNLQISFFINALNSTLGNFVKIKFVSHTERWITSIWGGGCCPPCTSAWSPPSTGYFWQTLCALVGNRNVAPCYPEYASRSLACYCGACVLKSQIISRMPSQQCHLLLRATWPTRSPCWTPLFSIYLSAGAFWWSQRCLFESPNSSVEMEL